MFFYWDWVLVILLYFVDFVWVGLSNFSIVASSEIVLGFFCIFMGVIAFYYRQREAKFFAVLQAVVLLLAYCNAAAIFSYLLASLALPSADDALNAIDIALHLDWMGFYGLVHGNPIVLGVLKLSYHSAMPQFALLAILFGFCGYLAELRSLVSLFMLTSLICVIISAIFPAAGPFLQYGTATETPALLDFLAVRNGTLIVLDSLSMKGIVEFPSFHMALAMILFRAALKTGWLAGPLCLLNILMIISTPIIGGHYFVDLAGGAAVFFFSLWLENSILAKGAVRPTNLPLVAHQA